jgi:hypothetical protein
MGLSSNFNAWLIRPLLKSAFAGRATASRGKLGWVRKLRLLHQNTGAGTQPHTQAAALHCAAAACALLLLLESELL